MKNQKLFYWLLGVIHGDGYVHKNFVEVSDRYRENLQVVKKVTELFRKLLQKANQWKM